MITIQEKCKIIQERIKKYEIEQHERLQEIADKREEELKQQQLQKQKEKELQKEQKEALLKEQAKNDNRSPMEIAQEKIESVKLIEMKQQEEKKRAEERKLWENNQIKLNELRKHNTKEDCWISYNKIIYNVTKYLKQHPGGINILLENSGKQVDKEVKKYHPHVNIEQILQGKEIGMLQK